jgi:salicylate hydroxylase
MHEDPARMKQFFAGAAAFTNNADLQRQNDDAMDLFKAAVTGEVKGADPVEVV